MDYLKVYGKDFVPTPEQSDALVKALCDSIVAKEREVDLFGNPDKVVCFRSYGASKCSRFYAVDMKKDYVSPNIPSTKIFEHLDNHIFGYLSSNSTVYCIGYSKSNHGKGFCFDFRYPDLGWTESPNLEFSPEVSAPVFTKDRIYAFIHKFVEVYNPYDNPPSLKRLPIHNWPQKRQVEFFFFPDLDCNRILLCFQKEGLYSLDPDLQLERIDPKFSGCWSRRMSIADGVLYSHSYRQNRPIYAYDLEKMKELGVKWESKCGWGISEEHKMWSGLFHLGDGIMCLTRANQTPPFAPIFGKSTETDLTTLFFKVRKCGESILATPGPIYATTADDAYRNTFCFFTVEVDKCSEECYSDDDEEGLEEGEIQHYETTTHTRKEDPEQEVVEKVKAEKIDKAIPPLGHALQEDNEIMSEILTQRSNTATKSLDEEVRKLQETVAEQNRKIANLEMKMAQIIKMHSQNQVIAANSPSRQKLD